MDWKSPRKTSQLASLGNLLRSGGLYPIEPGRSIQVADRGLMTRFSYATVRTCVLNMCPIRSSVITFYTGSTLCFLCTGIRSEAVRHRLLPLRTANVDPRVAWEPGSGRNINPGNELPESAPYLEPSPGSNPLLSPGNVFVIWKIW